ncbi:hypothetical protein G6F56_010072 [Rhizopus delemar]|nr:hypothetical protein G6F56_010072 [Rhizopus delemar]
MADENEVKSNRQSVLSRTSRRSTFYKPDNQGDLIENPENTSEYNAQLKKQYKKLQEFNQEIEITLTNFQQTLNEQKKIIKHVNDTEGLIDIWSAILEKTEKYKDLLEDPEWEAWRTKQQ